MVADERKKLAALLRRAAEQAVPEREFWGELRAHLERAREPVVELAFETATHYWGNFHRRSIFFLFPLKPNRGQLQNGKSELRLIADALEGDWPFQELKQKLKAGV